MNNSNVEVRIALMRAGLRQWELAGLLGVREGEFSKVLSVEQPEEFQEVLINAIESIDDLEAFREAKAEFRSMYKEQEASKYADRIIRDVEARIILREDADRYGYDFNTGGKYD